MCASLFAPRTAAARARGRASPAHTLGKAVRAFHSGSYQRAFALAAKLQHAHLQNADYATYIAAQSAFLIGKHRAARDRFHALSKQSGSRFSAIAAWRFADCEWELGQVQSARKEYTKLIRGKLADVGDQGLARFRIAEAYRLDRTLDQALSAYREVLLRHPAHPLASRAEARLRELGGPEAAALSAGDRIARAKRLTADHRWHAAIAELRQIGDDISTTDRRKRDFWTGVTLFKMRRRYEDAGHLLLGVYKDMGSDAAYALFHGARALSRADFDPEAIRWYQRVVAEYPKSKWAAEAQFLSGWLEFNMGHYRAAVPYLEKMLESYSRSRWATEARWFLGFSHFLLGNYETAIGSFEKLAKLNDRLKGGRGRYWLARSMQKLGREKDAVRGYRELVGAFPFSWYALLSRARLKEQKIEIGVFGDDPRSSDRGTAIDQKVDERLAADPLIRAADELIAAGLPVEAGRELRRGEKAFLKRHDRAAALAMLLQRYKRAGNYNRPWYLAVVYGKQALLAPPKGQGRVWWQYAYPLAYDDLIEKWRHLGNCPKYYLTSIMRKESGFDPHVRSYAEALGLLQMIPPTTRRVVRELDMHYSDDLLYDPELNIKVGSWYIGRLLSKFKHQIPIGAGSFNAGPRPWMRWLKENGEHPMDEFIELVSYRQARGYAKKVTETYARYLYLYEGVVYEQPLVVDREYVVNKITY